MNIGHAKRFICPRCGSRVIVSQTATDFGRMTEYRCVSCAYYHSDEFKYGEGGQWSRAKDDDLPIVAPDPMEHEI